YRRAASATGPQPGAKNCLGNVSRRPAGRTYVDTEHSELQTVEFGGTEGLSLVADEWNRGTDRPSVLLLHGGGQNRFSWKKTGQVLADKGLHVVALDSRGHGDSDRSPEANYSLDVMAADTHNVVNQIGRPVALVGASMG